MANQLVTFGRYLTEIEAHVVANVLASEGIRARLADSHFVTMKWSLSNAVGGVKVLVRDDDFTRASDAIREATETPLSDDDWAKLCGEEETSPQERVSVTEALASSCELTGDEKKIARALRIAGFGLVCIPIQLASLFLLLRVNAAVLMRPENRFRVLLTLLLNMHVFVLIWTLVAYMFEKPHDFTTPYEQDFWGIAYDLFDKFVRDTGI